MGGSWAAGTSAAYASPYKEGLWGPGLARALHGEAPVDRELSQAGGLDLLGSRSGGEPGLRRFEKRIHTIDYMYTMYTIMRVGRFRSLQPGDELVL